jgi:hypothetical protein
LGIRQAEPLDAISEPVLREILLVVRAARDHVDASVDRLLGREEVSMLWVMQKVHPQREAETGRRPVVVTNVRPFGPPPPGFLLQALLARHIFQRHGGNAPLTEYLLGIQDFDADERLAGADVQRDIIVETQGSALVLTFEQADRQGVGLRIVADFHRALLTRQSRNQKPWSTPLLVVVVVVVIEYPRDNDNEIFSTVCSSFAE